MIIDTHCHFDMMPHPEVYISAKERVGDIVIGMTNLPSHFRMGQPYIRSFKYVRLALGLHPLLASESTNELALFNSLLNQTSYVGEIGLDFSKEGIATKNIQIMVLRNLLESLRGKKKIISIHSRKAERVLFDLLCEYNIENVIFHWYSGPVDLIPSIISKGYYFSINESMTKSKSGCAILEQIPRNRILTETDAPYNTRMDLKKTLANIQVTEKEIQNNFMTLLANIR